MPDLIPASQCDSEISAKLAQNMGYGPDKFYHKLIILNDEIVNEKNISSGFFGTFGLIYY